MSKTHFAPYGQNKTRCGLGLNDYRLTREGTTERRKETTCGDCQKQMTDLGDFPEVVE